MTTMNFTMNFTVLSNQTRSIMRNGFVLLDLPKSHPFLYEVVHDSGCHYHIMSRRDDYQDGQKITIDCTLIGYSGIGYDNSPAHFGTTPSPGQQSTHSSPATNTVNSDVIVMVDNVGARNGLTEVSGEIFYVDPQVRGLPPGTLKDAFKDKAKITVLTNVKQYNFHAGHTCTFEKLKDITVSNGRISAQDGLMPGPISP